jgi:TRAP-type C4-dicarboxylate transport system substrate-binding protein
VRAFVTAVLFLACPTTFADPPRRLHLAAVAPEGTDWAGYLRTFSHEVEAKSGGRLQLKWTLGGTGGDEPTLLMRVLSHDLDGVAGAVMCERLAPSLRALELIGLVSGERQARAVLQGLSHQIDEELRSTPFRPLFVSNGFGHRVLFSRRPVRSLTELRRGRWWVWDLDEALTMQLREMGVPVVPMPLESAAAAGQDGVVDGFIAVPGAAVAFGLYAHTHYYTDLESGFLPGCLLMSASSFEALSASERTAMVTSAARLKVDFENAERHLEADLDAALGRVGLKKVPMSGDFRAGFFAAGRDAIERLGDKLAPRWLVEETRALANEK